MIEINTEVRVGRGAVYVSVDSEGGIKLAVDEDTAKIGSFYASLEMDSEQLDDLIIALVKAARESSKRRHCAGCDGYYCQHEPEPEIREWQPKS